MPGHTRTGRRRPRDHPLASEVVGHGEEVIISGLLGLGGVRAHLPPRPTGPEAPADGVPEGLADDAPVGVVAVVVGLAAYPAADAHLAHHLQRRLVGYAHAPLGAQAHGDLPVAAVDDGGREGLHERPARNSAPASIFGAPARTPARMLGEGPSRHALGLGLSVSAPP